MFACENCGKPTVAPASQCPSCGTISSDTLTLRRIGTGKSEHSLLGQMLSHYQVLERLGAGGMGVAYRAIDSKLGRAVALKVLAPQLADDPTAKARFIREARAASALDHPNIATIYEIGQDGPILFIVMALYEGQTLRQRLNSGRLGVEETVSLLRQMASGLAAAHAAGIVHRDIKPANVMLTRQGTLKLLDFGLAKLVAEHQAITMNGETVGTLLYTAPEQLRGERVDHRADLWALGAVVYEMIIGSPPFKGESAASTTRRILETEPAPLVSVPGVPTELSQVVSRLLDKDPANRIQTAAGVIAALDNNPSGARTAPSPAPRRRSLFAAALLALAAAGSVAAFLWTSSGRTGREAPAAAAVPRPADPRGDLLQTSAAQSLPAGQELAAQAAAKANDAGARLTVADAKAIEGHLALLAGDFDRAERSLALSEQLYSSLGNRNSLLEVLHDRYLLEWRRGASWTELDRILTSAGRVASELGDPSAELAVLRDRADHALWAGDLPGASALLQGKLAPNSLEAFASGKLGEAARLVDSQLSATGPSTAHRRPQLLVEKGNILLQQGNLEAAKREFQAAVEASQSLGAQPDLCNARVGLAALAVEGADFPTAEQLARGALDIFVKRGIALFEPAARIALARALLAQDRRDEAKSELERADQLARRVQLGRERLEVAVLSARVDAASKKRAAVESAVVTLKKTASDAVRLELKYQELLARQAIAEIEIVAGIPTGQAHWAALQQDAAMSGFGLFKRLEPPPPSQQRKPAAPGPYRLSKIKLE